MNQKQFLDEFKAITQEMHSIAEKKNHDYSADSQSPFRNFTMVETMGASSTEQGFFTRMNDKMMRIAGFLKTGVLKVTDEKIEDTLMDLANYSIIFICYLRSKKKNGKID